ncbi:hypothetical protein GCM10010420_31690 [Streptomyces glaucosporus]|uniref:Pentapeptide repeat-containing protein n=1 Tax=Streptomyces glaucosporus TaxID=284044 RepID=A0ABN3IE80_9ACTN
MTPARPEPPPAAPPAWPHCGHRSGPDDPAGCRGARVAGHGACLAHLDETDRAAHLASLSPGDDVDHRGTPFTEDLLNRLLDALRDPGTGRPLMGTARFDEASFAGTAWFNRASFSGEAWFAGAVFAGDARFGGARFLGDAWFAGAVFSGDAWFDGAALAGADFADASLSGDVWLDRVTLTGDLRLDRARFEGASHLGPLVCGRTVSLDRAVFGVPVTVEVAARRMSCVRTRWQSTATLRLRHAELDLTDAIFEYPVAVAARSAPFSRSWGDPLPESPLAGRDPGVRLTSVSGIDAAHLVLQDVDLGGCRFAGAVHLDQLRVDGWCTFGSTPAGSRRWSPRRTLAEEHHWRARTGRTPARTRGWTPPPDGVSVLQPAALAALYRQIRKSLEDGKNEPDAADFYYGEMEMRRHDTTRPRGERALLAAYWALSGYGLRATRALGWLLGAMTATVLALMLWGLPAEVPRPTTTGRQVASGQTLTLVTDTPDPRNPAGPWSGRLTAERFEKALRVVINSVVFRSSGQDLTTAGTYTEMASRFAEPALLGLAVLAVRSRVKR